ncbi:MAG: sodium:solute symporter [Sphingobacteriia bacterium]|nr:sodium:solute symporter [Sphingobacteriia bacterium]
MSPLFIAAIIVVYFAGLIFISYLTTRKLDSQSFYNGNKKSPWYIIAIGMIGTSISGVTFISVPGWVMTSQFSYLQMVLGYLLGYFVIANVLMPLYYRMNLTSIYTYLEERFGFWSYKTGASFFLISRIIGASFRLFLVSIVLQKLVFEPLGVPFWVTVTATIMLIWLYTFKGGIKTIIWTDLIQTIAMLSAVVLSLVLIKNALDLSFFDMVSKVYHSEYSRMWFFDDPNSKNYFWKQFLGGAFTTIVMTGLDQDLMQKNLACKNVKDAKKNMYSYGFMFLPINLMFLSLGALLGMYAHAQGIQIPANTDQLFPMLATGGYFNVSLGIIFIIGIIAAAYASADSALAALTTSFMIDILNGNKLEGDKLKRTRTRVHLLMSLALVLVIIIFDAVNNDAVISAVFTVAGYTYGPLLGLYAFGLFTPYAVKDKVVPYLAVLSPVICYILSSNSVEWFNGYKFGFELLILNGLIMFLGMLLFNEGRAKRHKF